MSNVIWTTARVYQGYSVPGSTTVPSGGWLYDVLAPMTEAGPMFTGASELAVGFIDRVTFSFYCLIESAEGRKGYK